ncbi:K+/H+ antiporter subunit F [Povalibacter sp.]|uniref:K+/H+ antiporter subunit F n=1 Tax=Povalibacter sp. TaxID=1962978 RepID=UPI002F40DF85
MNATVLFDWAAWFAQVCLMGAIACAAVRLIHGPSAQDRVLALDALYVNGMLSILMLGIRSTSTIYFDMAVLIALFAFIGSMALSKFLLRGEVIEP